MPENRAIPKVYVVEDDESLRQGLISLLDLAGYQVAWCESFDSVSSDVLSFSPDVVLLDLKLPGVDGLAIIRSLRERSQLLIIMLTSSDQEFDEVMSMKLGADDYVTKPYRPAVLLARIEALCRRAAGACALSNELQHRGVSLDLEKSIVSCDGKSADLTRNEMRILSLLMRGAGSIISRQDLMCELWESDAFVDDNTLTVNVNRLRKQLSFIGAPDDFLITRRGQGYMV